MAIGANVLNRVIVKVKDITYSTRADSITPTANNSPGVAGQLSYDQNYLYVCVAQNSWKRIPLNSW